MLFIPEKCIMQLVDALEDLRVLKGKGFSRVERRQRSPATRVSPNRTIDPCVLRWLRGRLPIFKRPIRCIARINVYS